MAIQTYNVIYKENGVEKKIEIEAATEKGISRNFSAKMRKEKRKGGIINYHLKV